MDKSQAFTALPSDAPDFETKEAIEPATSEHSSALYNWSGIDAAELSCWSRLDDRARMVLARDRSVIWMCTKAATLIGRCKELRIVGNKVSAANANDASALEHVLAVPGGETRFHSIPMLASRGHLVLGAAALGASGRGSLVGLTILVAHRDFQSRWPDFTEIFGLTAGEDRVVRMLLNGFTPQLVAVDLSLSIDTVRTHIRHAYEKLGISHREELWARLAPYRLN